MSDLILRNENLPAHLRVVTETGAEDMGQFIVPPRVKIIQPTSKGEYREKFSPGDAILVPQMIKIVGLRLDERNRPTNESDGVIFTPLFFFPEYCLWNPLESRGTLPMIRASSFDPKSDIAAACRDPQRRLTPCPEMPTENMRYVEHLNFIILMHGEGFNVIPALLSFSRAEHRAGTNFIALMKMRLAPIYGCRFEMKVRYRSNDRGQWYGIDVDNPQIDPFVDERTFEITKHHYHELKKAHENRAIKVDHDDDVIDSTVVNTEL